LRGVDLSPLWTHVHIGRHAIRRFTGKYQPDGAQIWTDGAITLDSLYRFKGQDAPAIILTDVEDRKTPERLDRLLYCGMGRATVRLDVLVKGNTGIGKRLGEP
jgi:superfamily I DNA and RNA helicase